LKSFWFEARFFVSWLSCFINFRKTMDYLKKNVKIFICRHVEIWPWNLAPWLRMSNEALGIFLGSGSFLVASEWGFK
jgi:hypothetical protein